MTYLMKSGILYEYTPDGPGNIAARLKKPYWSASKTILGPDGVVLAQTGIENRRSAPDQPTERVYQLRDDRGNVIALAAPDCAKEPPPEGWPICRLPRTSRADVQLPCGQCRLAMQNSRNYCLTDAAEHEIFTVHHRGTAGGWILETQKQMEAGVLCGLFVFCRYLDMENEFLSV